MDRRHPRAISRATILNNVAANGAGTTVDVEQYGTIKLIIRTQNNASMTLKVQGSAAATAPNFASAASYSNPWAYKQINDELDATNLDGGTGLALSGVDMVKEYVVNVSLIKYLNVIVSNYSSGNATVEMVASNNS